MFPGKKTVVYTYILGLFVVTTPYWHSALTFLIFFLVSESPLCWRWGCQEAKHFSRAQLWLYNGVSFWTKKNTQHWQLLAPVRNLIFVPSFHMTEGHMESSNSVWFVQPFMVISATAHTVSPAISPSSLVHVKIPSNTK